MDWCSMQGVFLPPAPCSQDMLLIQDPDQDEINTEDDSMNK